MQSKVLLAMLVMGGLMAVFYLRSMGPRCGDDRCSNEQYCLANELGGADEYVCESLPEDCGSWPSCDCVELPSGYECEDNIWGYVTVTLSSM